MTKQRRRFVTAALAVLALLPLSAPATATTVKVVTFVGEIRLSGCIGLSDFKSIPAPGTVKPGPKGEPQVNFSPGGAHCNFALYTNACVKTSAGKKTGLDVCFLQFVGAIWGYCGHSTGMGMATIVSANKVAFNVPFKFTNVLLGVWAFSGGNARTHFYAEVRTVPATGSCANGTAVGFNHVGDAVFKDITP